MSLIKTSVATSAAATASARAAAAASARAKEAADRAKAAAAKAAVAKAAAAKAVPVGKRAGTTAIQGVRQGVQGARVWATPLVEDAVQNAREWAAPVLEDAADAVTDTVAPKVSTALRTTARRVRPPTRKTGIRRLLDWRWLLGVGAAAGAAGAAGAITMRRRYASATAQAKDATESPAEGSAGQADDTAPHSDVNGRVATPGS